MSRILGPSPITVDGPVAYIDLLVGGLVALVDAADADAVAGIRWYPDFKHAASTYVRTERPKRYLHRIVLDAPPGTQVDHRDGNGLDNRRSNLRLATPQMNMANARPQRGRRFKGVSRRHDCARWQAYITVDGHRTYLGLYDDEMAAARAYDRAAVEAFGSYARLNLP